MLLVAACTTPSVPPPNLASVKEAIRIYPDHVDAHSLLRIACIVQDKLNAAISEFKEAIRIDTDDAIPEIKVNGKPVYLVQGN
jgi:hypothetical protein